MACWKKNVQAGDNGDFQAGFQFLQMLQVLFLVSFYIGRHGMERIRLAVAYGLLEKKPRIMLGFCADFFFKQ